MKTKLRILVTRLLALLLLVVAAASKSVWEERDPLVCTLLFLAGCTLVGAASIGRLWCSVYIGGRKSKQLVAQGPYSLCRNPLYFFSLLGALGVGLATETLSVPAVVLLAFAVSYPAVIRREERKLEGLHGAAFAAYCARTPRFLPRPSLLAEPAACELDPRRLRRDLFGCLWFVWLVGMLELFEGLHDLGALPVLLRLP